MEKEVVPKDFGITLRAAQVNTNLVSTADTRKVQLIDSYLGTSPINGEFLHECPFDTDDIFDQEIYNLLTENYTVRQILAIIKKQNYKIKIKKTASPILNQNSYKVSKKKFDKFKVNLSKNIHQDIKNTLNLIKNLY